MMGGGWPAPLREGRELLEEGTASAKAGAGPLDFILCWMWTGPGQGPSALLEPGVQGLGGELVSESREEVMAELRHPRLWPLPTAGWKSTKHRDNGLPAPPPGLPWPHWPLTLSVFPVPQSAPRGGLGVPQDYFSMFWGW